MADDKTIQELLEKQNNFIQAQKNYWRFSNNDMEETPNIAFLFFNLKLINCVKNNQIHCIKEAQQKGLDLDIVDTE